MMIADTLFWFFSIALLACGVLVIASRNPVTSAMFLVALFVFMAGLFVLLGAFFLAVIQILVYAGAVMVLFLFVIMLLDIKERQRQHFKVFGLIGRLSKGYRQRVGLAQALMADPPVLVLDEPTTGLDPTQIKEIRELIRALGQNRAVILSTHILPEVSMLCSRVMMINQGQILASGTVRELASCLEDREAIHIKIKDKQDQDRALKILSLLPGIWNLKVSEEVRGETFISFETSPDEDLRPRITKLFVEQGVSLLEIQRLQLTLEDIFLGLLREGKLGRRFP